MNELKFIVKGQSIKLENEKTVVSSSVGIYKCVFEFDEEWSGLSPTAVFRGASADYQLAILDGECILPAAAIATRCTLFVGVYGTDDGARMPTIWSSGIRVSVGVTDGVEPPPPPEPSVYEQIIEALNGKASESYVDEAVAAVEAEIPDVSEFITDAPIDGNQYARKDGEWAVVESGGGGTSNYDNLQNRPKINGITLSGNKTTADLGIAIPSRTSQLTNDSGFLTEHQDISGLATKKELEAVEGEIPDVSGLAEQTAVDAITAKIPTQATAQNQLADKAFVNSSIATNTANFIGTFDSVAELEAHIGTKTQNDYAFVIIYSTVDPTLIDAYDRYKWNGSTWLYEYELNNSSFTAAQWAAINSGITEGGVEGIEAHIASTAVHVSSEEKSTWNGKQDAISDLATIRTGAGKGATSLQTADHSTVEMVVTFDDDTTATYTVVIED